MIDNKTLTPVEWVNGEWQLRDDSIPLLDAIRAFRDRPSMERELAELRAGRQCPDCWMSDVDLTDEVLKLRFEVEQLNQAFASVIENYEREAMENIHLRAKCERLEAGLREISGLDCGPCKDIADGALNEKGEVKEI